MDSLKPNDQVVLAELPDGTGVLLHLETRLYYSLNQTGLFVWKALTGGEIASTTDLGKRLADVFEVDADRAAQDASALLRSLHEERLVVG